MDKHCIDMLMVCIVWMFENFSLISQ